MIWLSAPSVPPSTAGARLTKKVCIVMGTSGSGMTIYAPTAVIAPNIAA